MIDPQDELFEDFEAVKQIPIVPMMLDVVCQVTGMGFAAVARVTEDRWLACSVRDDVNFGLAEGGELKVETTICNEIRGCRTPVVIDHVADDPLFKHHHTPKMYGLQSYISVPIILKDGSFFGTLCAIDSKPANINNTKVIGTFTMFAELLAFHLQSLNLLERSHKVNLDLSHRNKILTDVNNDLDNFVYTASHDLKSPIANITALIDVLSSTLEKETLDRGKIGKVIELMKTSLNRFSFTLSDLTTFIESNNANAEEMSEEVNFLEVVEHVKQDLNNLIAESNARIDVVCIETPVLNFPKKNLKSMLYNLVSNAIKYRSPERAPQVVVSMEKADGKLTLCVEDNGLGIPADKKDKVFTMFQRFHNHVEGSGLGLYIVKRMIDNSKGKIDVDSVLNKGTKFTITF